MLEVRRGPARVETVPAQGMKRKREVPLEEDKNSDTDSASVECTGSPDASTSAVATPAASSAVDAETAAETAAENAEGTEDQVSIQGTITSEGEGRFTLQGTWFYKGNSMGKFVYTSGPEDPNRKVSAIAAAASAAAAAARLDEAGDTVHIKVPNPGELLDSPLVSETTRQWTGSFTMLNPAFEEKRKKKRTSRKFLTVAERFSWRLSSTETSGVFRAEGFGRNRFGRFSLGGELNVESGSFVALKEYLARGPDGCDGGELDELEYASATPCGRRGGARSSSISAQHDSHVRASKRQRVPNRLLKLDAAEGQSYAFIARHGNGSALTPSELAMATGSYFKQRENSDGGSPLEAGAEDPIRNAALHNLPLALLSQYHQRNNVLRDVRIVLRRPMDVQRAAKVRQLAKRRMHMVVQRVLSKAKGIAFVEEEMEDLDPSPLSRDSTDSTEANLASGGVVAGSVSKGRSGRQSISRASGPTQAERVPQIYQGEMEQGVRHGLGVIAMQNGVVYEGQWTHGVANGRGKLFGRSGKLVYMGDLVDGAPCGRGSQFFPNGDRYDGEFREGLFHGFGVFFEAARRSTYYGEWNRGRRSGHGSLDLPGGSSYVGDWLLGLPSGRGTLIVAGEETPHRLVYEGSFKDGRFDGRGSAKYDGEQGVYEGVFRGGCREGRGSYKFANSALYEGRFRQDKLDGFGTLKIEREQAIRVAQSEWIVPVSLQCEMKFVHRAAGFGEDGL